MRPETIGILTFIVSLTAYTWLGFLWIIYETTITNYAGPNHFVLFLATFNLKVLGVAFFSTLGAIATSILTYVMEGGKM